MTQSIRKSLNTFFLACLILSIISCKPMPSDEIAKDNPSVQQLPPAPSQPTPMPAPAPDQDQVEPVPPDAKPGKAYSWYYTPNAEHQQPRIPAEVLKKINDQQAIYIMDASRRVIYLTFDEGYKLGYTSEILDILHANDVKAAFFITGHYVNTQPLLVKRMRDEGHLVCNHTQNHKDLALLGKDDIIEEIALLEKTTLSKTGVVIDKYLRPPMGNYSDLSLAVTREIGYTSVFWSMALVDWDPNKQPGAEAVYRSIIKNIHPGAVILLHGVSQSDTEALDRVIKELIRQGYSFSTFDRA